METTLAAPRARVRQPLSALSKVTIVALIGFAATIMYAMLGLFGEIIPPFAIMAAVAVVLGGLLITGWRWIPALAAVLLILPLVMLGGLFMGVLTQYSVAGLPMFMFAAILLAVLVVGIVSGISATIQNYRRSAAERRTPRLLVPAVVAVVALVAGASLVVAAPQPGTVIDISPEAKAALPALVTEDFEFVQKELRVKAGETVTLRLDNLKDFEGHFLDIDELNVHAPIPPGKSSVVVFTPTKAGEYTIYCSPHSEVDPATGQRQGMVGKLIVEAAN